MTKSTLTPESFCYYQTLMLEGWSKLLRATNGKIMMDQSCPFSNKITQNLEKASQTILTATDPLAEILALRLA